MSTATLQVRLDTQLKKDVERGQRDAVNGYPEFFMDEYMSRKYYGQDGPCPQIMHVRNCPAVEGGRGCLRACLGHLEEQGKLTRKFVKPFKRRREWSMDAGRERYPWNGSEA